VFKAKLQYARDVRDGAIVDPRSCRCSTSSRRDGGPRRRTCDPKNFYVTNPNLGASVDEEFLGANWEGQNGGEGRRCASSSPST
jgi:phage terminase large subunit-like protein